jgi:ATP-dependent DNA helicase RecG
VPLQGVSESVRNKLKQNGISSSWELALHLPVRYEDQTKISPISQLQPGNTALVEAEVVHSEVSYRPRRNLVARIEDGSGELFLRYLHFYPSQQKLLATGNRVRVYGDVRSGYFGLEMVHPKCNRIGEETRLNSGLTPVYPSLEGLQGRTLEKLIQKVIGETSFEEIIPKTLLERMQFPRLQECIELLHSPPAGTEILLLQQKSHPAWQRIKFDELLAQQLTMRLHYKRRRQVRGVRFDLSDQVSRPFIANLKFALTSAQCRVIQEIYKDMSGQYPMRRLLQGDVGSGKTVVAALAALAAVENGYQVAFMSPTEILAEQHFQKVRDWFLPMGLEIAWLTGAQSFRERSEITARIASGKASIVVGTHALIQDSVVFHRLGLAVVDEQHKFGVKQRLALQEKGVEPHQLMMSATPIPRTLAMSYFADMDVSVIDELPPGRSPIITKLINSNRRDEIIARVREAGLQGQQVYWVCSLIEESAVLQLQTAEDTFQRLKEDIPELPVGLIHGRMGKAEKAQAMDEFKRGQTSVLVATTVIEVGVDVPNASLMVIENAERMGLAQLHQLRGRVGRGSRRSMCILMYQEPLSETAKSRLKIIFENTDGFEIARQDMQLRGPGELLGAAQSGIPMLRFADIEKDADLMESAQQIADEMLQDYPEAAEAHMMRWLGRRQDFLHV